MEGANPHMALAVRPMDHPTGEEAWEQQVQVLGCGAPEPGGRLVRRMDR
jgi:hypothetical protein